jgi:histidinol-phosphate/aromatic aminotransferase/cobyric acid decarboxylase-like protein
VLRSPSKFFGLAGARVGVAWSPSADLRDALRPQRGSWPVSAIEVAPVAAALADDRWISATHAALTSDARWLDGQLRGLGWSPPSTQRGEGLVHGLVEGSVTHFRLLFVDDASAATARLAAAGLGVRPLGAGHGLPGHALRIAAPQADERDTFAAMSAAARLAGVAAAG